MIIYFSILIYILLNVIDRACIIIQYSKDLENSLFLSYELSVTKYYWHYIYALIISIYVYIYIYKEMEREGRGR